MTTENELQFQVEANRSMATPEQALSTLDQVDGKIAIFSSSVLSSITTAQGGGGLISQAIIQETVAPALCTHPQFRNLR
ncbi:hypothetical protein NBRC116589_40300 [Ruegeria sp. HU-ET01832]|uniref:hypothetical protein n=1 Tax=Ruegeria sp. HU-ET01832 TaxID=3135906 RepID=UPI00310B3A38